MKKSVLSLILLFATASAAIAQNNNLRPVDDGTFTADGYKENRNLGRSDSIQSQHKEIPRGIKVWTIKDSVHEHI